MKALLNYLKLHLPYLLGVALVVVNYLVDNGYININAKAAGLASAILGALGLGVLHSRQQKQG